MWSQGDSFNVVQQAKTSNESRKRDQRKHLSFLAKPALVVFAIKEGVT